MACEDWTGHVIVYGLDGLGLRIVEELRLAGERLVVVADEGTRLKDVPVVESIDEAGLAGAAAVVCVERADLQNLEISLQVRELRPDIRVITSIANVPVGRALATGKDTVLNVAALSAPSLVEACLRPSVRELVLADVRLVMTQVTASRGGTLRELFGELAPLVVAGPDGVKKICPGRDERVGVNDRVTLVGTREQFEARDLITEEEAGEQATRRRRLRTFLAWLRTVRDESGRGLRTGLAALGTLIAVSTLILWTGYQRHGMSVVDSLYLTVATIATVGYGDFNFAGQPTWLRLYAVVLMALGVACTATILAYFTDMLITRRLERASGRRLVTGMAGHVVLAGLGSVGTAVVAELVGRGEDVVVIERDEDDPYLAQTRALKVPVIFGDATQAATLAAAGLATARAVALLTSDDMVNIEAGLAVRDTLGEKFKQVPIVLRVFDRPLARTIEGRFGFGNVRSTARLAAPWFVGAALGLDVLATFDAENELFLAGRFTVAEGSPLDGLELLELAERTRVVAIERPSGVLELSPRRATGLGAGDQAYAIGPYAEILRLLRRSKAGLTANVREESSRVFPPGA
jgi:Trk K+ transport system NAD-binding subunit